MILTNKNTNEVKIIMRDSFSKEDRLKDFLADNKDCKVKMMFIKQ